MTTELQTDEAKTFWQRARDLPNFLVRFENQGRRSPITTSIRFNTDLFFESNLYYRHLLMYGYEQTDKKELGFLVLAFRGTVMQDEAKVGQLFVPRNPVSENLYTQMYHPEIQRSLTSSLRLQFNSAEIWEQEGVLNSWEAWLNNLPPRRFPQSTAQFPESTAQMVRETLFRLRQDIGLA